MPTCDLAIVGAGPAGLAAASTAARAGLTVTILDEQPRPGGQIYRDVDRVLPLRGRILGQDYADGASLTAGLKHAGIACLSGAVVWSIEPGGRILYSINGKGTMLVAKRILLATGALERAMPVPGWTLSGVMTAGAGQILLKQSGVVSSRAALVGSGPLLYLLAAQMCRAGTPPLALVETQTRCDFTASLRHLPGALRGWRDLSKGLSLLREIRSAGVPRYRGARDIVIEGDTKASAMLFSVAGKPHRIDCETVFLHHGVVPNTQAARSMDIEHHWDTRQVCFVPTLDMWGQSSVPAVFVAGDGAGIGGAKAAALAGRLAALKIAEELGGTDHRERDRAAAPILRRIRQERAVRPFLETAYPPAPDGMTPADTTTVCRCENVTAGDVRRFASLGCLGPNQAKAFGRVGMGPCQGRVCGLTVSNLLAQANGQSPDQTGYYRIRPPIKPVTLSELAGLDDPHDTTGSDSR